MARASSGFRREASLEAADRVLTRVAFNSGGDVLAVPDQSGTVHVLGYPDLSVRDKLIASAKALWTATWSGDASRLAVAGRDNTVHIFDIGRRQETLALRGHTDDVHAIGWSADDAEMFSASYDGTLRLWRTDNGAEVRTIRAHGARIEDACWEPDSRRVATGGRDGRIRLWDVDSSKLTADLAAHRGFVVRLLMAQASPTLISASSDGTVRVWDRRDLHLLHVLEGFGGTPHDLSLSHDERLLAVKDDGTAIRFFRTDTFELVELLEETADHRHWYGSARFHPTDDGLVTTGESDRRLTTWSYHGDLISRVSAETSAPRYANCRVGVLGNTGVGKTALAAALRAEPFRPTESTHGTRVSLLDRTVVEDGGGPVVREIYLWDFAGQPTYRLLQRLDVEDMVLALLVLDNRNTTDPRGEIREWETLLRTAAAHTRGTPPRIVVIARVDRGSVHIPLPAAAWEQDIPQLAGVVETSAKDGTNIEALRRMVLDAIDWDKIPMVTSDGGFQRLRMFVVQSVSQGRVLERIHTLYAEYTRHCSRLRVPEPSLEEFRSLLSFLDAEGLIRRLSFGDLVLLDPSLLRSYASMLLIAAQRSPTGDGTLREDDVLGQRVRLPAEERVRDPQREQDLLHAALQEFLGAGVVLREGSDAVLRFPSAVRRRPDEQGWRGLVAGSVFGLTALADHTFASLVVALCGSGLFDTYELWTMTARFGRPNEHGSWLRVMHDGAGRIWVEVRHEPAVSHVERAIFEELCRAYLVHSAVGGEVTRRTTAGCPSCGAAIAEEHVRKRRERGFAWMTCGVCDAVIDLADGGRTAEGESAAPGVVNIESRAARARAEALKTAEIEIKAKRNLYDVFISYSHQDEAQAMELARSLASRGVRPWLDIWETKPGKPWLQAVQEQIDSISCAVVLVGPSGIGPWQREEVWYFLQQFFARRCPVIPVFLEGAEEPEVPSLLANMQWVDFRRSMPNPMDQLVWGITGIRPEMETTL